jgi:cell division protein FtsW (lipid II flippase)
MTLGFLMVLGSDLAAGRPLAQRDLLPLIIYALCLLAVHLGLVAARFQGDQILLATLAFLAGFGLLAQYRMGTLDMTDLSAPGLYLFPAGILLMLTTCVALMRGRYEHLSRGRWLWGGLSLVLVVLLLLIGQRFRGAVYGAGLITPTELLKVTVVLFLASVIARDATRLGNWGSGFPRPPLQDLLPLAGFWLVLTGLLLLQRDLGMLVILGVTLLVMLFVGTGHIGYLILGGLGAIGMGGLVLLFFAHGQHRIDAWLSPFQDPTGNSWQILQGLSGMYAGGLWGEGFGQGDPEYTPIAQSDFIYSVIGEELGFVGCALVVLFFLIFFSRGLGIADQTRSAFGRLVCVGLISVLATQTFLNLGGVTKFIPLTGITLPFISHGGSSLLTGFISLGLLLAISEAAPGRLRKPPAGAQRKRAGVRIPRAPASSRRAWDEGEETTAHSRENLN